MLTGQVTREKEAIVILEVQGRDGQAVKIEAAIDTGFNGFLTLPRALIDELELPFLGSAQAALGNGNQVEMDLFLAVARWTEGLRNMFVLEAEGGVLVGMLLLDGCRIILDVEEGGVVSIESLEEIRSRN